MILHESVAQIQTRNDLVAFLGELLHDLRAKPEEWENCTLESYLEAMAAFLEDAEGYYANQDIPMPQNLTWKTIGDLLLAAKHYE